jgi:hypothetical protein
VRLNQQEREGTIRMVFGMEGAVLVSKGLFPFISQTSLLSYRIFIFGRNLRFAEYWRMFMYLGNATSTGSLTVLSNFLTSKMLLR